MSGGSSDSRKLVAAPGRGRSAGRAGYLRTGAVSRRLDAPGPVCVSRRFTAANPDGGAVDRSVARRPRRAGPLPAFRKFDPSRSTCLRRGASVVGRRVHAASRWTAFQGAHASRGRVNRNRRWTLRRDRSEPRVAVERSDEPARGSGYRRNVHRSGDREPGRIDVRVREDPHHPGPARRCGGRRHGPVARQARHGPVRDRQRRARHHALRQCPDRTQGGQDRSRHHQGISRRDRDRTRASLRYLRPAHEAPPSPGAAAAALRARRTRARRRVDSHPAEG